MSIENDFEKTERLLKKHGQSHLLAFWSQLDAEQKKNLLRQLNALNLAEIDIWIKKYIKEARTEVPVNFTPATSFPAEPADTEQLRNYSQAIDLGKELIKSGKVAPFIVAGGQGTRLGFDGPKGDFHISPVKNKTLFQIFAESINAFTKKYDTSFPWYIMTSPLNHNETIEIFSTNDYYGLDKGDVFIFEQGTMPNFDLDGKILLADKDTIACSPDGHGGSIKALYNSGALADMKKRGIEYISYFQVDNPLVKILDPLFIGLHALSQAQMSSKALIKTGPKEKVGNFCLVDGRVTVIEYSDLPDELAEKRNPDGSLLFQLGSTAIHTISVAFAEKLNSKGFSLPLHRAVKKIPHVDKQGNLVEPEKPNGIKLESFVFDALPLDPKSVILEIVRSEEFAPVKNADGVDSPEVARKMMIARAADWLESAGIEIPRKDDGTPDCQIEIAPSFAVEREDIKEKLHLVPKINPKDKIYLYINSIAQE